MRTNEWLAGQAIVELPARQMLNARQVNRNRTKQAAIAANVFSCNSGNISGNYSANGNVCSASATNNNETNQNNYD